MMKSTHNGSNKNVGQNYEDILVKKYLEEIQNKNDTNRSDTTNLLLTSPYLKKVCGYSYVKRIKSTESKSRRSTRKAEKFDADNVITLVQVQKKQQEKEKRKIEPEEYYYVKNRSRSASRNTYIRPSSAPVILRPDVDQKKYKKPVSKSKFYIHSYRKKPVVLKAFTYKNGTNENPVLITSHTIKHFLEAATIKLNLPRAARRLFSSSGYEIFDEREFKKHADVFVSCGEEFIDPLNKAKELIKIRQESNKWDIDGVRLRTESEEREREKNENSDFENDSVHGVNLVTIFNNGKSNNPVVIDTNFDIDSESSSNSENDSDYDSNDILIKEFLNKCSTKLEINARAAYDWCGNQIKSLNDIPKFNSIIKIVNHIELTPVWISKGEGFDPHGPLQYVSKFIDFEKHLLRDLSDENSKNLKTFKNYTKREFQNLNINEYIHDDVNEIKKLINYLVNLKEKLIDLDKKYEGNRSNILMQHIKEVSTKDLIFGGAASKGLLLKIHINGNDKEIQKLYFNCKESMNKNNRGNVGVKLLLNEINRVLQLNRTSAITYTRIFDEYGNEITQLSQLTRGHKIWISTGENWKSPVLPTLNMQFFTLNVHSEQQTPSNVSVDVLQAGKVKDYRRSTFWSTLNLNDLVNKIQNGEIQIVSNEFSMGRTVDINEIHAFLQCKSNQNLIMCPKIDFQEKIYLSSREQEGGKKNDAKDSKSKNQFSMQDNSWLKNQFQLWSFNEDGYIYNHYFPKLCLVVDSSVEYQVEVDFMEKNSKDMQQAVCRGYLVTIMGRHENINDRSKLWRLNSQGQIYSQAIGDKYVLTSIRILKEKLEQCKNKQNSTLKDYQFKSSNDKMIDSSYTFSAELVLLDKFGYDSLISRKLACSQRWAIKQEGMQTIGQWRFSKVTTPEWHKLAYTWPVDENEEYIDDFDWPISGYLIPNAPPLKTTQYTNYFDYPRVELKVLKNGELNELNAVTILTPDVKHIMKEYEHCTNITIEELEFNWFLDNCTSSLHLPFAARRLFDMNGVEYFNLHNFKYYNKVDNMKFYVTCGEAWIDPRLSREEIDNKTKLLRLIEDYKKLFHLCCLRSCKNFDLVIETSRNIDEGAPLIISPCILNKDQRKRIDKGESIQTIIDQTDPNYKNEIAADEKKTAHQRAHDKISSNKKIKWPWENIANKSMENLVTTEESVDINQNKSSQLEVEELKKSFDKVKAPTKEEQKQEIKLNNKKPKYLRKLNLQKFTYNQSTGYIYCTDNPSLVFGVETSEGNVNQVILMRRNESDINQRWIINNNIIALKARPHLVLTVQYLPFQTILKNLNVDLENDKCILELTEKSFKNFLEEAAPEIFTGSAVTLQRYVKSNAGGCNQKWNYEEKTGFIFSFKATDIDIDVTSAIQANLCTFNVFQTNVSQPGYSCQIVENSDYLNKEKNKKKKLLCLSCAFDTRGKYKLKKLPENFEFFCEANKDKSFHGLTGFRYLPNKHDLSIDKLFLKCRDEYIKLSRKRTNTSPIKKESERMSYMMKFILHKNGCDYQNYHKCGDFICGTNIRVLLDQATQKLALNNAARKFFTINGTPILDYQDLINYCHEYYKFLLENLKENTKLLSESRHLKKKQETIYDNGPNLFEIEEIFDKSEEIIDSKSLLKWPIHIWVSCGEPFINPEVVSKNKELKLNHRKRIEEPGNNLDTQTHVLRNMTGRRFKAMDPGVYKPVQNPDFPVTKEGHWSNIPYEEQVKQLEVEELKKSFDKVKAPTKEEQKLEIKLNNKSLYDAHDKKKRVLIYANGENVDKAIKCWASSLDELIEQSKVQLRLNKPVKFIYTQDGKIVTKLDELKQDQILCISTGAAFIKPEERAKEIEAKANWSRVRKIEGEDATYIHVTSSQNPIVDVDPFGPPLVATRSITFQPNNEENNDDNDDDDDDDDDIINRNNNSSSNRLKNLRFQHQHKKALNNNNNNDNIDKKNNSLLD